MHAEDQARYGAVIAACRAVNETISCRPEAIEAGKAEMLAACHRLRRRRRVERAVMWAVTVLAGLVMGLLGAAVVLGV